jgi:hypothetical protein
VSTELALIRQELADPSTEPARLSAIAAAHPELATEISKHPNIYPALQDWLNRYATFVPEDEPEPEPEHQPAAVAQPEPIVAPEPEPEIEPAPAAHETAALETSSDATVSLSAIEVELADQHLDPARLAEIAHAHPEHHALVAAHPSVYPALLEWVEARMAEAAAAEKAEVPPASPIELELADPQIAPARLAEIAHDHPEYHVEIAKHPVAYDNLLDWLESRDSTATRQAVAERRANRSQSTSLVPAVSSAVVPVAPPGSASVTPTSVYAKPVPTATSAWEKADKALTGVEKAGEVMSTVLTAIYGIFLIIVGIVVASLGFSSGSGAGWAGVLIAVYGFYVALPLPGYKLIIW